MSHAPTVTQPPLPSGVSGGIIGVNFTYDDCAVHVEEEGGEIVELGWGGEVVVGFLVRHFWCGLCVDDGLERGLVARGNRGEF